MTLSLVHEVLIKQKRTQAKNKDNNIFQDVDSQNNDKSLK